MEQQDFQSKAEQIFEERQPNFNEHINVAVVGKVSAGKSSLINAILGRGRSDPIAPVGAKSGVTTKVTAYKIDKHVLFVDCPGLSDVRSENSEETQKFLSSIDLGLFVVTGSADASQKSNYDDLKKSCKCVLVILNKIDEWDNLEESAYEEVENQWKLELNTKIIYGACTKGYDPQTRKNAPMDIRGVDELKKAIFSFLEEEGKAILLARNLKNKDPYAIGIISSALAAVALEAFIPGSAAYITATQAVAITSLHYLYTGQVLSKTSALALLPTFAGQSVGTTLFLWAKSLLPPTGAVDIVAATVAISVTLAMLSAVKWVLESGYNLENKEILVKAFGKFKSNGINTKDVSITDFTSKANISALVARLIGKQ